MDGAHSSPNDNGAQLRIGQNYGITATAATGFAFTDWYGGTTLPLSLAHQWRNRPIHHGFQSDAGGQFCGYRQADTLSITNITSGMSVSNQSFTVKRHRSRQCGG